MASVAGKALQLLLVGWPLLLIILFGALSLRGEPEARAMWRMLAIFCMLALPFWAFWLLYKAVGSGPPPAP